MTLRRRTFWETCTILCIAIGAGGMLEASGLSQPIAVVVGLACCGIVAAMDTKMRTRDDAEKEEKRR